MWFIYLPVALLCMHVAYQRYFHPLAKIPGPFLASVTPLWLVWQCFHGRRPRLDIQLHQRYGSVVRISPNEIILSNPDYLRTVYGAGTRFRKSRFYEAPTDKHAQEFDWDRLDMLAEKDIEKLRVQKRFAGPVYSEKNAMKHEALVDNGLRGMLKRFRSLTGRPLDIYYEWEILNVDVLSEFTFGTPFGAIEAGSDGGHMHTMDRMWAWWGWLGFLPWLNDLDKDYMPWSKIFETLAPRPNLPVFGWVFGKIMEYDKAVEEGETPTPCLLDDLRTLSKDRKDFVSNWGAKLALTNLGAGVDTMSWTLAATIVGIGQNPAVQAKLKAELDAAVQDGRIKMGEPVQYEVCAKLPYLQACISESMRLWPNVAISLPRIAPKEGIDIDGYFVPEGYTVGMNSRILGTNEAIFGPEPHAFRPERWLEADKSRREMMESKNLSFGGASRRCPGLHVALFFMSKVLATFYSNYDLKVLNDLDGKPGPGGKVWTEFGSFPTKWHGLEAEITSR